MFNVLCSTGILFKIAMMFFFLTDFYIQLVLMTCYSDLTLDVAHDRLI